MIKKYQYHKIDDNVIELQGKRVIIWCESESGLRAYIKLYNEGIEVIGFADSYNIQNDKFAGLPSYNIDALRKMNDYVIYIATYNMKNASEILEKLLRELPEVEIYANGLVYGPGEYDTSVMRKQLKISSDKIEFVRTHLEDEYSKNVYDKLIEYRMTNNKAIFEEIEEKQHKQYFPPKDILPVDGEEVFVDAGAYNGNTSLEFVKWVQNKYKRIYLMEPDKLMYNITKEYIRIQGVKNTTIVNAGAYSYTGTISFCEDSLTGSSYINEKNGTSSINVISIDEMLNGERVSYIKMDIEGSEMEALKGARKTIEIFHPKLAICLYHNPDDLWELPYYIMKNYPWYKVYIRHYSWNLNETVMYATEK